MAMVSCSSSAQELFPVQSKHSSTKETVDIVVTLGDNSTKQLAHILNDDKNYVISIMASWCGPCRTELDAFQKVADQWKDELNTEVIAISVERPNDTYKLFQLVEKQQWTMQVMHDKMAYTSRELGVFSIPQTYLINRDREIVYTTQGFSTNLISDYKKEIEKLN